MPKRTPKLTPPRPEVVALLQTCKENPDDDTPRLILADWLEDHGDTARAEFIRVQCEAAHLQLAPERLDWLARREGELLVEAGTEWTQPLIDWAAEWEWRRGMCLWARPKPEVTRSSDTVARLFPRAEQLAWVEGLRLSIHDDWQIEAITALPQMNQFARLRIDFSYWTSVHASKLAIVLAASPTLANLRELEIGGGDLSDEAAIAICESPHLRDLRELRLHSMPPGEGRNALSRRLGHRVRFKYDDIDEPDHSLD